jgi:hypothetical protein
MPTLTPKIALKKPVVNVETDWGLRLNETIDILDGAALTANITGLGNVVYTDSGGGTVTVSGRLLVGKGAITLITEGSAIVISGTGGTHGALPGLGNDDHPQYAHLAQNETISGTWNFVGHPTISGTPVVTGTAHGNLSGLLNDNHPQYVLVDGTRTITGNLTVASGITATSIDVSLVSASSGTITNTLTVGSGVVNINPNGVTISGIRVATINDILTISGSGRQAFRTINAVGSGTHSMVASDYLVVVTGSATYAELILPPISSVLGQTFRIQLPYNGPLSDRYPNLTSVVVDAQAGELREGTDVASYDLLYYQITPAGDPLGMEFMAVGGDLGWTALIDRDV